VYAACYKFVISSVFDIMNTVNPAIFDTYNDYMHGWSTHFKNIFVEMLKFENIYCRKEANLPNYVCNYIHLFAGLPIYIYGETKTRGHGKSVLTLDDGLSREKILSATTSAAHDIDGGPLSSSIGI
jgi:hypothetical protein